MALFLFTNSNWYRASNNFTGNSGHYQPRSEGVCISAHLHHSRPLSAALDNVFT